MTLKNIIEMVEKTTKKLLFIDGQIAITYVNDIEEEKTTLTTHCYNIDGEVVYKFDVILYFSAKDKKYAFSTLANIYYIDKANITEVSNMYTLNEFISIYVLDEDMTEVSCNEQEFIELTKQYEELENELQATRNELEDTRTELEEVTDERDDIQYKLDNIKSLVDDIYTSVEELCDEVCY